MSHTNNPGSSGGKPSSSFTMMGGTKASLPPAVPVIGVGAPTAPPMDAPFADAAAARTFLVNYVGPGPNYGQLTPVPSGFQTYTTGTTGTTVVQNVFYRRQTQTEKGTKSFWVLWIWPGCQNYELHVHYRATGGVDWINFCVGNFGASTGLDSIQIAKVKKGGITNPPKDPP